MKALVNLPKILAGLGLFMVCGISQAQNLNGGSSRAQIERQNRIVNLRWQASALAAGMGSIAAEFKMSEYFSFGPSAAYVNWRGGDVSVTGSSIGLQATYAFEQIYKDSWFVSPRIAYSPIRATTFENDTEYSGDVAGATGSAMGGYQWFWDSFNVNLAGGLMVNSVARLNLTDTSGNKLERVSQYYTGVSPQVSVDLGYVF